MKSQNEEFKIIITSINNGKLSFSLLSGNQKFITNFIDYYDPIANLRKWIEALVSGEKNAEFKYLTGEEEIIWIFQEINPENGFLELCRQDNSKIKPFLKIYADRNKIVKKIYLAFQNFFNSYEYRSEEWERELLMDRLCKTRQIDKELLLDRLLRMNRVELLQTIFDADPFGEFWLPEARDEEENFQMQMEPFKANFLWTNDNSEQINKTMQKPAKANYDYWSKEEKLEYIEKNLNRFVGNYNAENPAIFQSDIVENYLNNL
jgi:hypothetical protein